LKDLFKAYTLEEAMYCLGFDVFWFTQSLPWSIPPVRFSESGLCNSWNSCIPHGFQSEILERWW